MPYAYMMYAIYLLTKGRFQMNLFWEITTAAVILIGTVTNLIASFKQTKSTDDLIGSSKSELKTEHASLTVEHQSLSKEHNGLSKEHTNISEQIKEVKAATEFLKIEAIKADALKQNLPKKDLDLHTVMTQITATLEANILLRNEINELKNNSVSKENYDVLLQRLELSQQKAAIRSLQEEKENGPEL